MKPSTSIYGLSSFISLALAILMASSASIGISPLRTGKDTRINDIQIEYNYEPRDPNQSHYQVTLHPEFATPTGIFSFCFMELKIVPLKAQSFNCELTDNKQYYDCLTINDNVTFRYYYWKMDKNLTAISEFIEYVPNQLNFAISAENTVFNLKGRVNSQPLDYLSKPDAFYRLLTVDSRSFASGYKTNYLQTFPSTFNKEYQKGSTNVLLQRFPYCYLYNRDGLSIYNLLFVGGVLRQGIDTYLMSFIHFEVSKQPFQMWQGLAFSSDKAGRDMIGIRPKEGIVEDLYSLFARAPWPDISSNIGGNQDLITLASSSEISQGNTTWFYHTNIARPYKTNDPQADQDLIFKINNKFCYVMHARREKAEPGEYSYLENNSENMHGAPQCFQPDLDISESRCRLVWFLMILLISFAS